MPSSSLKVQPNTFSKAGFKYETSIKGFYSKMNSLNLPIKKADNMSGRGVHYEFFPREVYVKMRASQWFQHDDECDKWVDQEVKLLQNQGTKKFSADYFCSG